MRGIAPPAVRLPGRRVAAPGVTVDAVVAATGWTLKVAASLETTRPPAEDELTALRELQERTARAHAAS